MPHRIRITEEAERDIRRLPGHVRQRVRRLIRSLAESARPAEAKELRGNPGYFRIRLDRWRIIYRIDDDDLIVLILRVRLKTGPETYGGVDD